MNRTEIEAALDDLVARGKITRADAAAVLAAYDAGAMPEPPDAASVAEALADAAIIAALLSAAREAAQAQRVRRYGSIRVLRRIQNAFDRRANDIARAVAETGDTKAFEREARRAVRGYIVRQSAAGGPGTGQSTQRVARAVLSDLRAAHRFSVEVWTRIGAQNVAGPRAAGVESVRVMSEDAIAARLKLYGGQGQRLFYEEKEMAESGGMTGYVYDYIAVDDPFTCSPCIKNEEEGPYLPGRGPMPASNCLGRNRCRCVRRRRYAPDEYAELRSREGATA